MKLSILPLLVIIVFAFCIFITFRAKKKLAIYEREARSMYDLLFAFGLAGFFTPSWEIGDVAFAEVTAGGDLGNLMAGSVLGVVGWTAIGLTSGGLLWPKGAWFAWQGSCKAGRLVRSRPGPERCRHAPAGTRRPLAKHDHALLPDELPRGHG